MAWLVLIYALCALLYVALLAHYAYHFQKIPISAPLSDQELSILGSCTIIIPARNEAATIARCVNAVLNNAKLPDDFKIIVVDDHSTDDTSGEVDKIRNATVSVIKLKGTSGKKAALIIGINRAASDFIVTIDADIIVSDGWLAQLLSRFRDAHVQAITGLVHINDFTTVLSAFQSMDVMATMIVTGGGLHSGWHALGNGANMAFRRSAFEAVGGYQHGADFASGDDIFLLERINTSFPGSVRFEKGTAASVFTNPEKTITDLFRQRLRWSTKVRGLSSNVLAAVWAFLWAFHTLTLITIFYEIARGQFFTAFIILASKMAIDYVFLCFASARFGKINRLKLFAPAFLLQLVYVPIIGVATLFMKKYKWKGRKVR